jgi:hypothetical protein
MKRKITLFVTLLTLSGAALHYGSSAQAQGTPASTTPVVKPHRERHPAIHAAIRALEKAKLDLKEAAHDFGGHRETALKECDAAVAELKQALQFDKN